MALLSNYLLTQRKRLNLSQEEMAFLLGMNGPNKTDKVSRHEHGRRAPTLRDALAYEALCGKPVRELFAGLYGDVEREVAQRVKLLEYQTENTKAKRPESLINLASKITI